MGRRESLTGGGRGAGAGKPIGGGGKTSHHREDGAPMRDNQQGGGRTSRNYHREARPTRGKGGTSVAYRMWSPVADTGGGRGRLQWCVLARARDGQWLVLEGESGAPAGIHRSCGRVEAEDAGGGNGKAREMQRGRWGRTGGEEDGG